MPLMFILILAFDTCRGVATGVAEGGADHPWDLVGYPAWSPPAGPSINLSAWVLKTLTS